MDYNGRYATREKNQIHHDPVPRCNHSRIRCEGMNVPCGTQRHENFRQERGYSMLGNASEIDVIVQELGILDEKRESLLQSYRQGLKTLNSQSRDLDEVTWEIQKKKMLLSEILKYNGIPHPRQCNHAFQPVRQCY